MRACLGISLSVGLGIFRSVGEDLPREDALSRDIMCNNTGQVIHSLVLSTHHIVYRITRSGVSAIPAEHTL